MASFILSTEGGCIEIKYTRGYHLGRGSRSGDPPAGARCRRWRGRRGEVGADRERAGGAGPRFVFVGSGAEQFGDLLRSMNFQGPKKKLTHIKSICYR